MPISIIIPFHGAAPYLEEAVASCLIQAEVKEVLLVNDQAEESALQVATSLAQAHPKVKLLHGPSNKNIGPAAARNMGIKASTQAFIAFLDADDVYMEHRFQASLDFLLAHPEVDGYYVATEKWNEDFSQSLGLKHIRKEIAPEQLLVELIKGRYGFFDTAGILLRRQVFQQAGYFNEQLCWHQDTELFLRLAFFCHLQGQINGPPLTRIRIHFNNHSKKSSRESKIFLWQSTLQFFQKVKTGPYVWYLLLLRLAIEKYGPPHKREYLGLLPLFFEKPAYFWIWLKKWMLD